MYIGKEEMELIIAFLAGVEFTSKYEITFQHDLTDYIFQKYSDLEKLQSLKNDPDLYTLIQQVEILGTELEKSPTTIFKKEAIEFLQYISDDELGGLYIRAMSEQIKDELVRNIESNDEHFTDTFTTSRIDQILKELNEWHGRSLTQRQMELLKAIKDENTNRVMKWHKRKEGEIDDRSEVRRLSRILLSELAREDNGRDSRFSFSE